MAQLFGHEWSRRELERYAPLTQYAGIKRYTLMDGFEKDVQIVELDSGAGLRIGVSPSRGMDIVWAKFRDVNLCWRGENGIVHPAYYQETNFGWLRGFFGGLVATCGLGSFGPPCEDEGEWYGIHDRFSYTPATEWHAESVWHDEDSCSLVVRGTVRQARLFGPNLRLERSITVPLGGTEIILHDRLTNDGFQPEPAVILYHCNYGFPLLEPGARIEVPSNGVTARDSDAERGLAEWAEVVEPEVGFAEQVFFHDVRQMGSTHAAIVNERLGVRAQLNFDADQLPFFTQWRMLGTGAYVTGLEPSNAPLMSRADLRRQGQLPILEPGESKEFKLRFTHEVL